jgi:hypothetical protein
LQAGEVRVAADEAWWAEQWTTAAVRQEPPSAVPDPVDIDATRPLWAPADDEVTQPLRIPEQSRPQRRPAVAGAR